MKKLHKIISIEDDSDIQTIIQMSLETVGMFDVQNFDSGKHFLEHIERLGGESLDADLILMDVMMPEIDGPTTLEKLKLMDAYNQIPVIFMTAKVQAHEIASYIDKGAVDVIMKPFDPIELPVLINEIWEKLHNDV